VNERSFLSQTEGDLPRADICRQGVQLRGCRQLPEPRFCCPHSRSGTCGQDPAAQAPERPGETALEVFPCRYVGTAMPSVCYRDPGWKFARGFSLLNLFSGDLKDPFLGAAPSGSSLSSPRRTGTAVRGKRRGGTPGASLPRAPGAAVRSAPAGGRGAAAAQEREPGGRGCAGSRGGAGRRGGGAERSRGERSAARAADRRHPGPTRASRSGEYPALPCAERAPGYLCSPGFRCSPGVPRPAARRLHRCEHRAAISWVPVLTLRVNAWDSAGSQRRGIARRPAARRGKVIPCALNSRSPALLGVPLYSPRKRKNRGEAAQGKLRCERRRRGAALCPLRASTLSFPCLNLLGRRRRTDGAFSGAMLPSPAPGRRKSVPPGPPSRANGGKAPGTGVARPGRA